MSILRVAEAAGVSHTTVSRVLNGHPGVSSQVCRRVQQAIVEVGYTPPLRKRGPRPARTLGIRTRNIVVLNLGMDMSLFQMPVYADMLHGIELALADRRLNMSVVPVTDLDRLPTSITTRTVDGLIALGQAPSEAMARQMQSFQVVWVMSRGSRDWGDRVCINDAAVGALAAEYLLRRGHQRLAVINAEPSHIAFQKRVSSFQASVADRAKFELFAHDEPVRPQHVLRPLDEAQLQQLIDRYVATSPRPTGLFIPSDLATSMAYRLLKRHGVRPGRDCDIISCNNERSFLAALDPRPATIDILAHSIGRRAVDQLLWRMQHADQPGRIELALDPVLVESESIGMAAKWSAT